MRDFSFTAVCLLWVTCLPVLQSESAPRDLVPPPIATREQLIGAWRLVAIEYRGPRGETVDPFYQAGSLGIIIYEASGWMSVQIAAPNRRTWKVPEARAPSLQHDGGLKAQAFDTYYSYYGRWDFDAASSVVIHHVVSSLISAEDGVSYAQSIEFEGGRLVFIAHGGKPGAEMVRKKIWERLPAAP